MGNFAMHFLRKLLTSAISVSIALSPLSAASATQIVGEKNGQYFYRYKTGLTSAQTPDTQGKDVTAFYVAGVGVSFSELLPLKPEWQDDNWTVVSGSLPAGITFNGATRRFEGVATGAASAQSVDLVGIDSNGNQVATARATFDVYEVIGQPIPIDFYAHTGKYRFDQIAIPAGVSIYSWDYILDAPPGMTANGPFLQGTPSKAGKYNLFGYGKDYNGKIVATFFGPYLVEDGPSFPLVADMVYPLPMKKDGLDKLEFSFGPTPINRVINPSAKPRYFIELGSGSAYPGNTSSNHDAKNLLIEGDVWDPYQTAKARWRVVDSDDLEGFSNWFEFGSSYPQPECNPDKAQAKEYPIPFRAGSPNSIPMPKPRGTAGTTLFTKLEGTFPTGITMDPATGLLTGTPTVANERTDFRVRVDVINPEGTVSAECHYFTNVLPAKVGIVDSTDAQAMHVRMGDVFNGSLAVSGGIPNYSVSFANPSELPGMSFTSPNTNSDAITVSAPVAFAGLKTVEVSLTNGDTSQTPGWFRIFGHPELAIQDIPTVVVKRLDAKKQLGAISYDPLSVIPDVLKGDQPQFTLSGRGFPDGVEITDDGVFEGTTSVAANTYGPFNVTISDYSGDKKTSNPFNVIVEPRDEIETIFAGEPSFEVESGAKSRIPVLVKQPEGARDFTVSYVLNSPDGTLPSWLSFNQTTGELTAAANIPYSEFEQQPKHGPFTITVTDQDSSTATSAEFFVHLTEKPYPSAYLGRDWRGNVSGSLPGQSQTPLVISGLRPAIDPQTIYGTQNDVIFVGVDPSSPAGLTWDPVNATISGEPQGEFNGSVAVRFKDTKGREGVADVPLIVKPYPAPAFDSAQYDVARLSNVTLANIRPLADVGFWPGFSVSWEVDTARGPDISTYGLTVDPASGQIGGRTEAAAETVIRGVVLKATTKNPVGNVMSAWTPPVDLKIVTPEPLDLTYAPSEQTYYMVPGPNGTYTLDSTVNAVPTVFGSYKAPLAYSIDLSTAYADGLTPSVGINQSTGFVSGVPTNLGIWTGDVTLKDAEGAANGAGPVALRIKSTLAGYVEHAFEDPNKLLRIGEPFATAPIAVSNVVRPVVFTTNPANLDATAAAGFDAMTGSFSDVSTFEVVKNTFNIEILAKDAHGRGFLNSAPPKITFRVLDRLMLSVPSVAITGKQFSAETPISAAINPTPTFAIGDITYSLSGDLPGTLVNKNYNKGTLASYSWTDGQEHAHVLSLSGGIPSDYTVDGASRNFPTVEQDIQNTLWRLGFFPVDSIFFDTVSAEVRGIPSKAGTFVAQIVAHDSHANDYIRNVASRMTNNTSEPVNVTFNVEVADPLVAANSANSDHIEQYTSQSTLVTTLLNDAYGLGIKAHSRVGGTLPDGVSVSVSGNVLSYPGYAKDLGTFGNNVWLLTDAAGRQAPTTPVAIEVGPRGAFVIAADDPIQFAVDIPGSAAVTTNGNAFGVPVPASGWTITGAANIPEGITYTVADGSIVFSGTATTIGKTSGMVVSAVDSLGTTTTANLNFEVVEPSGAIELLVSDIATKVGYPYEMASSHSNTYGKVRYYSYDITGDLADQLALNGSTGLVTGIFNSVGDRDFDIYVTDATNRVTSKPVAVNVMPNIRVTVPDSVPATQGLPIDQFVQTDYVLGTATYEMGGGDWPEGINVDPATGNIVGHDTSSGTPENIVTAAAGRFDNLTIKATDTFEVAGVTYTDVRLSNPFAIVVAPTDAAPDIIDPVNRKVILGQADVAMASWKPTVQISGVTPARAWNFGGTTYTPSHDLTQYGLAFDADTGTYSGTPTKGFIIRDFTMRVTSQRGDTDVTNPFWIGVAPKGDITPTAGQTLVFNLRTNDSSIEAIPLQWDNVIGNLTHANVPSSARFNIVSATGELVLVTDTLAQQATQTFNLTTKVTDEFGREGEVARTVELRRAVEVSTTLVDFDFAKTYDKEIVATSANIFGTARWEVTGLPAGLTADVNTGALSGKIDGSVVTPGDLFNVTFKATDSLDQKFGSKAVTLEASSKGSFVQTATGSTWSCGLTKAGGVKCWGTNSTGVFGTGATGSTALRPVSVVGAESGINAISAGANSICAVTMAGSVKCWGLNNNGQLGLSTTTSQSSTPLTIAGLSGVADIKVGGSSVCALTSNGGVKCWGSNSSGQIGNGSTGGVVTAPADVSGLQSGVKQVAVGNTHACAVLSDGTAKCWGAGSYGALGDGTTQAKNTPVTVTAVSETIVKISAGSLYSCAVLGNGSVKCWGDNAKRNLGDGSFSSSYSVAAKTATGVVGAKDIFTSSYTTCAILSNNTSMCWGTNDKGQNAEGYASTYRPTPTASKGMTDIKSMAPSTNHGCATLLNGSAMCWGSSVLGDGRTSQTAAAPTLVDG